MSRFNPQRSDFSSTSFLKTLALRGLQPDHRTNRSKSLTNITDMACLSCFPDLPSPSGFQPDSNEYRCYLHKLPHIVFQLIGCPQEASCCMACDDVASFELYQCTKCNLTLCGVCVYVITDRLVRGDLRRLIEHVARWKVGYSRAFLEREKAEAAKEWEAFGKKQAEAESKILQVDMDRMFAQMVEGFATQGKGNPGRGLKSG